MTLDVREFIERGQPGLHFPGLNIFEHGQSYPLHQAPSFEAFIRGSSSRCIAEFFRSVLDELEGHRGLLEYHMKVMDDHQAGWCVRVWYGGENEQSKSGPIDAPMCMSCEMDCPLSVGVGAGVTTLTTRDTALGEFEFHRAWIDAKARPLLVLTPKRHVRRLSELSDDELVAFWRDAVDMIELEQIPRFNSLILNHGKFQNHAHLHLKIRIPPKDFYNAEAGGQLINKQCFEELRRGRRPCHMRAKEEDLHDMEGQILRIGKQGCQPHASIMQGANADLGISAGFLITNTDNRSA
eukprot:CAMPEP_0114227012 /NCGR_PEP_ID=MMETSP0058-20121206/1552_1 /TAXON_ID=36894 /ORGANISM="Pyramimonas parkeae, CCMP726" /LENGTH=294 /DNA_ID=CAMNT_0001337803 /DNA_START=129 /DNA_END=1014 /DNA_ORIENTATION=+